MAARPSVNVYSATEDKVVGTTSLPAVFTAPIRSDVVQFVHTNMAKNSRQAYGVNRLSGMRYAAHSWGTGRAVARIPRIGGGGNGKSGSGAFGNMCKGGRMFAPTKIVRRWHRKINLHQKRFAVVSALAASSLPSLLLARGHKIENIAEVPFVVDDSIQGYEKTKQAIAFLEATKAIDDINRVNDSKQLRAGHGKWRNRRYVHSRGPMLVLPNNNGVRAFRNVYGLDIANVNALNLLHLAPGGHLGRFVIWTKSAFDKLDSIFGTFTKASDVKKGFTLPRPMLTSTDVSRIMHSEEVRRVLKPKQIQAKKTSRYSKPTNGIANRRLRLRLNPFSKKATLAAKSDRTPKNRDVRRKSKLVRIAKAVKGVKASTTKKGAAKKVESKAKVTKK